MKSIFKTKIILVSFAALLLGMLPRLANATTPIGTADPYLNFEARNWHITGNGGATPTFTFDIYMSATQPYVDYITANGTSFGMQNVDVAYDLDFGTNGSAGPVTPTLPNMSITTQSPELASASITNSLSGGSAAPYDTKFKMNLVRLDPTSTAITTTPTLVASITIVFPAGTVFGTAANGLAMRMRNAGSGYGTGLTGSKWGDFNGNSANPIGPSATTIQILPVVLTSFTGKATVCSASLNWASASELNSSYYAVEHGTDGTTFTEVGKVTSKNSAVGSVYGYQYPVLATGVNYFRLRMVDLDGKLAYSQTITVTGTGECSGVYQIKVSPNPTTSVFNVQGLTSGSHVLLIDVNGKKLTEVVATSTNQAIYVGTYASGMYVLRIQTASGSTTNVKVVKQ